ncbi:MAG: hypothetical protein ACK4UN_00670 [Limisphaerales bacterium]
MKNQLRIKLGRLASIGYQRRLCVGGTKSQYVLPCELFESAANTVQATLASPVLSKGFDESQLQALREFLREANMIAPEIPFDSESVSIEDLIERDPVWNKVRASAQKCLDVLGLKASLPELLDF